MYTPYLPAQAVGQKARLGISVRQQGSWRGNELRTTYFERAKKTGSKLAQVLKHTCGGGTIKIAWIEVHPESLRNYLEEELIKRHPEADWNRENRAGINAPVDTLSCYSDDMAE
ncbi:hypothetical protein ACOQNQ_12770 [Pseudomonas juntendi]|uniref:hypothetical protein n=1 Tax=Pseudomonas juntendi TaxID=2666183 RepID=UPI001FFDAAF3|nr:hypothetical protein [Pseudomonas juntendi]MCK2112230.1 hypothetical protein [Pseudomonas juntendi]